jgi:hypothetical protein
MSTTLYAMFDGEVFRPDQPLSFAPNTRVRLTVEEEPAEPRSASFLRTARSLKVDGPPDWSARLDDHLYGEEPGRDG